MVLENYFYSRDFYFVLQDGKCGKTILHYAAETGNHVLLDFLLREGNLDLNALTYGGLSAVQLADGRCHKDVVSTLRSRGAVYAPLPVEENDSDEDMVSMEIFH